MKKIIKEHEHFEKFMGYKAPEFKSDSGEFHVILWNLNYISNIQLHAISLIGTFVDIVSNGSVRLSDFTSHKKGDKLSELLKKAHIGKGDGYNFLDRNERLTLANSLLFDLRNLNYNLEQLVYVSQYCGLREMLYNLDPMTWYNYVNAKYDVEYAIMQWNNDPLI